MRAAAAVAAALAACGGGANDGGAPVNTAPRVASRAPADPLALLHDLPRGGQLVFGADFGKLQAALHDSPLGTLLGDATKSAPSVAKWARCFLDPKVHTVGMLRFSDSGAVVDYAMTGLDMTALEACGLRAGVAIVVDRDRKFAALGTGAPGTPDATSFLALPDGVLLCEQAVGTPSGSGGLAPRAQLEALAASFAHGTAADDAELVAAAHQLDLRAMIWLVGTGAGTPLQAVVSRVRATINMSDGLQVDARAQVANPDVARRVMAIVDGAKQDAAAIKPELGPLAERVVVTTDGVEMHGTVALTKAEVQTVFAALGVAPGAQP